MNMQTSFARLSMMTCYGQKMLGKCAENKDPWGKLHASAMGLDFAQFWLTIKIWFSLIDEFPNNWHNNINNDHFFQQTSQIDKIKSKTIEKEHTVAFLATPEVQNTLNTI